MARPSRRDPKRRRVSWSAAGRPYASLPEKTVKRFLNILGRLVTILSLGFFAAFLWKQLGHAGIPPGLATHWPWLAPALAIYLFTYLANPVAWRKLLTWAQRELSLGLCIAICLRSQFAKYIPGNVAQHVSRVYLAGVCGVPLMTAAATVTVETVFVFSVGIAIVLALTFGGVIDRRGGPLDQNAWLLLLLGLIALAVPFLLPPLLRGTLRRLLRNRVQAVPTFRLPLRGTAACLAIYALNFVSLALVVNLVRAAAGVSAPSVFQVGACAIVAWLAGFITPGSPAGIGVRDTVMALSLSSLMPAADAGAVAVMHRLLTAFGDLLLFLVGSILWRRMQATSSQPTQLLEKRGPQLP